MARYSYLFAISLRLRQSIRAMSCLCPLRCERLAPRVMSVYFVTACLIVVGLSYEVSFRRSWTLSRNSELLSPARWLAVQRRAYWPVGCGLICMLLGCIVLHFIQDKLVVLVTMNLMMLIVCFSGGWFFGALAGIVKRA